MTRTVEPTAPRAGRRPYDSPLRRRQAAETRRRILAAGTELLRDHGIWKWRAVTMRAVAERAGVNERTVYRHFDHERALREAVLDHLREDAGVHMEGIGFDELQDVTRRVFTHVASFATPLHADPAGDEGSSAVAAGGQQRALLDALACHTDDWDDTARVGAAALVDVLWSTVAYGRLVTYWGMTPDAAADTLTWAVGLVQHAIRDGERPDLTRPTSQEEPQ